jgi:hypothetical protein
MLEYKSITKSWKTFMLTFLGAYLLSFIAFVPGENHNMDNLAGHMKFWPYAFCIIFITIAVVSYEKKIIPKLSEGITMLQSVALIYWVTDLNFIGSQYNAIRVFMVIGLIFSIYSLYNAFSYRILTNNSRFVLSFWSSLIMMVFALDNLWSLFINNKIDNSDDLGIVIFNMFQYFVLGISSIYIVQNFSMVFGFLPEQGKLFKNEYLNNLAKFKKMHIERYSSRQVKKIYALIVLLFVSSLFGLNYYFDLLPRNFVIWIVFILYPLVLLVFELIRKKKSAPKQIIKAANNRSKQDKDN